MPAPDSVLLIKPGSLGDIIHALPSVGYIRRAWPQARLTWIVDRRWKDILHGVPGLDEVVEFPREDFRGPGGWARSVAWFHRLKDLRPNVAIDLQGLMRSALMGRASGAQVVVGGDDAREGAGWLYQVHARIHREAHAVDRYRAILAAAGVGTEDTPEFPLGQGEEFGLEPDLVEEPFFLVHPLARGEGKSLAPNQVEALVRGLAPFRVVLAGRGANLSMPLKNLRNLMNQTTLPQYLWLARRAAGIISVDSGPGHIAAAVHPRVLVIHTWSDPRKVGPYSEQAHVWQGGEIRPQLLQSDAPLARSRPFHDDDVTTVVDWVRRHWMG
jgi:ADP-heptose:LPS heptosyltransferase